MEKKPDRRVQRTRRMLRDALIAVILDKGYEAVTVQDITERADLRRATFYLHYRDKEELLVTALEETFNDLAKDIEAITQTDGLAGKTQIEPFLMMFRHVEEHKDLYRVILCGQGAAVIAKRIHTYLANHVRKGLTASNEAGMPPDVLANYIAGAELALMTWWLEHDRPYPVEQMAQMAQHLILNGARGVLVSPDERGTMAR